MARSLKGGLKGVYETLCVATMVLNTTRYSCKVAVMQLRYYMQLRIVKRGIGVTFLLILV